MIVKDVEIDSLIEDLDDSGLTVDSSKASTSSEGKMKTDGDSLFIFYTEDGENGKTESEIAITGDTVSVRREGALKCDFLFSEGKTTSSIYSVGQYSFDSEIYTRKIRSSFSENGGEISLIYDMTLGGAKKKTKMKIRVKNK